ncbi:hypothetical protein BDV19DRAFT_387844 [Aspergillus venezuelensis]
MRLTSALLLFISAAAVSADKEHDKFMSFFHIAEVAQVIRDECGYYGGATSGGIVDHYDKWQVIVHKDDC